MMYHDVVRAEVYPPFCLNMFLTGGAPYPQSIVDDMND